jgi:hypothetical protein
MSTYIEKIHGFKREGFSLSSNGNQLAITEVVEVEAKGPTTTAAQIVSDLPSQLSGPGLASFNPYALTFTLGQSRHPDSNLHALDTVSGMKRSSERDRFWEIPLTYITPNNNYGFGYAAVPQQRRDQKVKKPDSPVIEEQVAIDNPLDRPPIFSESSKTIQYDAYFIEGDGIKGGIAPSYRILHTNGLPITVPVKIPIVNKVLTWKFNLSVTHDFPARLWAAENTANDDTIILEGGKNNKTKLEIKEGLLKCNSANVTEEWETPSGSDIEYHYLRATVVLEYSIIRWDSAPLSLHTKQLKAAGNLDDIFINDKKTKATAPWPLKTDGSAVPFSALEKIDFSSYGKLQANNKDLQPIKLSGLLKTLIDDNNLRLPSYKG